MRNFISINKLAGSPLYTETSK